MRELLDAKSEEVTQLAEERERGENGLFAARKELRRARRRLAQESHDLIRVPLQPPPSPNFHAGSPRRGNLRRASQIFRNEGRW